jgi:hypothetical protein
MWEAASTVLVQRKHLTDDLPLSPHPVFPVLLPYSHKETEQDMHSDSLFVCLSIYLSIIYVSVYVFIYLSSCLMKDVLHLMTGQASLRQV